MNYNDEWERRRAALDEAGQDEWYAKLEADHYNDHEDALDEKLGRGRRCPWCEKEEDENKEA